MKPIGPIGLLVALILGFMGVWKILEVLIWTFYKVTGRPPTIGLSMSLSSSGWLPLAVVTAGLVVVGAYRSLELIRAWVTLGPK